jgi:fused signal recognition particle receptor
MGISGLAMIFWKKKKTASELGSTGAQGSIPEAGSKGDALGSAQGSADSGGGGPVSDSREVSGREVSGRGSDGQVGGKEGWFRRALKKTTTLFRTDIRDLWKSEGELVDDAFLENLYAILIRTDMGPGMAGKIRDDIRDQYRSRRVHQEDVLGVIRQRVSQSLKDRGGTLRMSDGKPTVILVVGVNGSGKTTSIAKLAYRLQRSGKRVLLAAGDTFRAAAVEQLKVWSDRIGCEIVMGEQGVDPGSVAFKAMQRAVSEGFDVCIVDTAGRLQTQSHLMQQLEKVKRVLQKHVESAPHEVLLVLDATAGQNAISQAKGFSEAAGCTGIVLSKLDGTAKGGVIIPIAEQFGLPVKFIGLGESLEDLQEFSPDDFVSALFTDPEGV